jgi:hypothetical protein
MGVNKLVKEVERKTGGMLWVLLCFLGYFLPC